MSMADVDAVRLALVFERVGVGLGRNESRSTLNRLRHFSDISRNSNSRFDG